MKPLAIFPTHIWVAEFAENDIGVSNHEICEYLDTAISPRPELQHGRSWQTEQTLHQLPFFAKLAETFIKSCEAVLAKQNVVHQGIEITGCWANISPPGSLHTPHMHPNNILSGVFYPKVVEGSNAIVFHKGENSSAISPAVTGLNEYNAAEIAVALKPGTLVIFPSTIMHSVPPNRSSDERVSISFNVMFKDFSRTISPPKWQGIPVRT